MVFAAAVLRAVGGERHAISVFLLARWQSGMFIFLTRDGECSPRRTRRCVCSLHTQTTTSSRIAHPRSQVNDRQLACARIHSEEGQNYLAAMAAAANYAWVNRSSMTFLVRQAFAKVRVPPRLYCCNVMLSRRPQCHSSIPTDDCSDFHTCLCG
jgi:hypothetical protein